MHVWLCLKAILLWSAVQSSHHAGLQQSASPEGNHPAAGTNSCSSPPSSKPQQPKTMTTTHMVKPFPPCPDLASARGKRQTEPCSCQCGVVMCHEEVVPISADSCVEFEEKCQRLLRVVSCRCSKDFSPPPSPSAPTQETATPLPTTALPPPTELPTTPLTTTTGPPIERATPPTTYEQHSTSSGSLTTTLTPPPTTLPTFTEPFTTTTTAPLEPTTEPPTMTTTFSEPPTSSEPPTTSEPPTSSELPTTPEPTTSESPTSSEPSTTLEPPTSELPTTPEPPTTTTTEPLTTFTTPSEPQTTMISSSDPPTTSTLPTPSVGVNQNQINETREILQEVFSTVLEENQFNVTGVVKLLFQIATSDTVQELQIPLNELYKSVSILFRAIEGIGDGRGFLGSSLLRSTDTYALRVAEPGSYSFEGFDLNVSKVSRELQEVDSISLQNNRITLPREALSIPNTESVRIASFLFDNLRDVLVSGFNGSEEYRLVSSVISAALLCGQEVCDTSSICLEQPVRIELAHEEFSQDQERVCVFWDFSLDASGDVSGGGWSNRGCRLVSDTPTGSVCACNHLTHFAILLAPSGTANISASNRVALQVIGYVGVFVSLLSLSLTVLILTCIKSLWSMRNYIHIQLSLSLMASQLIFVIGVDKTTSSVGCSVVAVLLHYSYLVSFMWMLMEGVVLYVILVKVFIQRYKKRYLFLFTVLSYGLPLLYMCLTIPLGFRNRETDYGYEDACWLRYDTHFIWSFIVPAIAIVLINCGFFVMVMVILYKQRSKENSNSSRLQAIKSWLKSSISLVVVMGLTWVVGVLFFGRDLLAFAYIFTIFVAFQGLAIFVLFILLSKAVQGTLLECLRTRVNHSSFLSVHVGSQVNSWADRFRQSSNPELMKGPQIQLGMQTNTSFACSTDSTKLSPLSGKKSENGENGQYVESEDLPEL